MDHKCGSKYSLPDILTFSVSIEILQPSNLSFRKHYKCTGNEDYQHFEQCHEVKILEVSVVEIEDKL